MADANLKKIGEDAYRYAVKNAFLHSGKADLGAVVGKVAALHKGADLKKIMPAISEAVGKVNSMGADEIAAAYKKFEKAGYELKAPPKSAGLPELEWAKADTKAEQGQTGKIGEKVVTRFAPNPNGPFHLGNARAAILSHEYARMYDGKFLLRFDDTDPKVKKPIENAEGLFKEDLAWLGCSVDETFFASDRLEVYYGFMRKTIEMGKAYVCTCDAEGWKKKTIKRQACGCRSIGTGEQLKRFAKMLSHEYKEGVAVLRIKTDLEHADPSVRDWWAAKIVDKAEHPHTGSKYHVWPSYNFASAIDDHELGITLIIRGQEHAQNMEKQKFLYGYFGWQYPHVFHYGRIKLGKVILSTSKIAAGIERGEYIGWDDPRLGTIRALRRRGFDARALHDIIMELGVKSSDTTIEMKKLVDLNKHYIDAESERFEFIDDAIRLDVQYCPATEAVKEGRVYALRAGQQSFMASKRDFENLKEGTIFRLRNAYNARIVRKQPLQVFAEFTGTAKIEPIVSWLVEGSMVDVEVMMPDASKKQGMSSPALAEKNPGQRIYLEKFGYAQIDSVDRRLGLVRVWYTHK